MDTDDVPPSSIDMDAYLRRQNHLDGNSSELTSDSEIDEQKYIDYEARKGTVYSKSGKKRGRGGQGKISLCLMSREGWGKISGFAG